METKNDFGRRLWLFSLGLVIGSVVVYFSVFKNRNFYKSPQEVIIEKLLKYPSTVKQEAKNNMDALHLKGEDIRKILEQGDVEFSNSEVHRKPCPIYFIRNTDESVKVQSIRFELCDSTSCLINITP